MVVVLCINTVQRPNIDISYLLCYVLWWTKLHSVELIQMHCCLEDNLLMAVSMCLSSIITFRLLFKKLKFIKKMLAKSLRITNNRDERSKTGNKRLQVTTFCYFYVWK